jgi:hypothetical protein
LGSHVAERIDVDLGAGSPSLVIVAKIDIEQPIWHSAGIDQQAIEKLQIWSWALKAVYSWLYGIGERRLNELLHRVVVWECENWGCF